MKTSLDQKVWVLQGHDLSVSTTWHRATTCGYMHGFCNKTTMFHAEKCPNALEFVPFVEIIDIDGGFSSNDRRSSQSVPTTPLKPSPVKRKSTSIPLQIVPMLPLQVLQPSRPINQPLYHLASWNSFFFSWIVLTESDSTGDSENWQGGPHCSSQSDQLSPTKGKMSIGEKDKKLKR